MESVEKNPPLINLFPKPINRKSKIGPKSKLLPLELTAFLLDFFTYEELIKFCNANVHFYNAFVKSLHKTKIQLSFLSQKYNFVYSPEKSLSSYQEMNTDQKGLFFQIDNGQIKYYSLAKYFDWSWKDNPSFWTEKNIKDSIIESSTPFLISVCYLDTNFHFENILSGTYKLFIYHFLTTTFSLALTVKVGDKIVYDNPFPTEEMVDNCKEFEKTWKKQTNEEDQNNQDSEDDDDQNDNYTDTRLYKQFICDFTITKNDLEGIKSGLTVSVEFRHLNNYWKKKWLIHGGVLERTDIKFIMD